MHFALTAFQSSLRLAGPASGRLRPATAFRFPWAPPPTADRCHGQRQRARCQPPRLHTDGLKKRIVEHPVKEVIQLKHKSRKAGATHRPAGRGAARPDLRKRLPPRTNRSGGSPALITIGLPFLCRQPQPGPSPARPPDDKVAGHGRSLISNSAVLIP